MKKEIILIGVVLLSLMSCNKKVKYYYPTGELQAEVVYINDSLDGYATIYYPSGNIQERNTLKKDRMNDSVFVYYDGGGIMKKAHFIRGVQEGVYREYYENGQIKYFITFENGEKNGDYKSYYEIGVLKTYTIFKSDSIKLFVQHFSESGVLLDEYRHVEVVPSIDSVTHGSKYHAHVKVYGPRENHSIKVIANMLGPKYSHHYENKEWEFDYDSPPLIDIGPHMFIFTAIVDTSRYGTFTDVFVTK